MRMFEFIHAADLHIDSPLKGLTRYEGAPVEKIRSATRAAFDKIVEFAIQRKVAFVLLAGDLFDGDWPDYNTGLYFRDKLHQLGKVGIRVYLISGNHDAASQISRSLRMPENVHVFATDHAETVNLEDLGCVIHGQGFATRAVVKDLAKNYPVSVKGYFNIGILHTCLDGKPGHEPYAPCNVDTLLGKDYDYWALGHVHEREIVHKDPWIVFPGNIQGRHIRETGAKGCTLVSVADGNVQRVEHQTMDVFRWARVELDISRIESLDKLYSEVEAVFLAQQQRADDRPLALRLVITGKSNQHQLIYRQRDQILAECQAIAVELGEPALWLQKLEIQVKAREFSESTGTVIADLLDTIDEFACADSSELHFPELEKLHNKLPREIDRSEVTDLSNTDLRRRIIEEVRNLLQHEFSLEKGQ